MKGEGQRESDNVEDLRDQGGGGGGSGFGGFGVRHIGIGTIVIALVGGWIFGINPLTILGLLSGGSVPVQHSAPAQVPGPFAVDPERRRPEQLADPEPAS